MKFNWGTGIALFYSCFVLAMIGMVFMSTQNKSHLVQENYYQKDLNYETFRQKRQNGIHSEKIDVQHDREGRQLNLAFPQHMQHINGTVVLFRPSDKNLDRAYPIALDEELRMKIPLDQNFAPGLWFLQFEWKDQHREYYKEQSIVL